MGSNVGGIEMTDFTGSDGNDIFTGGKNTDTADGFGGDDKFTGNDGNDSLAGGKGSDVLTGGSGDDTLYSDDRSPDFNLPYYDNDFTPPLLDTGREVDTLSGGDGSDTLFAGYGDNVDGGDDGGYGDKLYISFMGAQEGVDADFRLSSLTIGGGTIKNVESVSWIQGSNYDDVIHGGDNGSGYSDFGVIEGMGGNDKLYADYYTGNMWGGDGNDLIDSRNSSYIESVHGGTGNDILYAYEQASVYGDDGNDRIYGGGLIHGGSGNDTITLQADVYGYQTYGDDGNDTMYASSYGNTLVGGSGRDTLNGSSGNDTLVSDNLPTGDGPIVDKSGSHDVLNGNAGDDALYAGYGDDVDGGSGNDTLSLSLLGAKEGVSFSTASIADGQEAHLGGATITHIDSLTDLQGSNFADVLHIATQDTLLHIEAGAGNDLISIGDSSVALDAGDGDDRVIDGAAGSTLDGGAGTDMIDYNKAASGVHVTLGAGTDDAGSGPGGDTLYHFEIVSGSAYADTITGSDNHDDLRGQSGDDVVNGMGGDDRLYGGLGDDIISGGAGQDRMTGGAGKDVFVFSSISDTANTEAHADRIDDYTNLIDKIDLHAIDAKAGGQDDAFTWIGDRAFTGHAGELQYYQSGGNTFVSGDVDGDGVGDFKIRIDGVHDLHASYFVL